jgi:hypothetical protein
MRTRPFTARWLTRGFPVAHHRHRRVAAAGLSRRRSLLTGVSACATCDGLSSGNRSRPAARRGGGVPTRFASRHRLRGATLRASKIMQDKAARRSVRMN